MTFFVGREFCTKHREKRSDSNIFRRLNRDIREGKQKKLTEQKETFYSSQIQPPKTLDKRH